MKPTNQPTNDSRTYSSALTLLQRALALNHAVYGLGIDVLAAYSPLLATLIPAWLTYHNTLNHLHFPAWVAACAAAAVEVLGISAVHTTIGFYQYNNSLTRKNDLRSPFGIALATALAYIAIVLVVNTGLDAAAGTPLVNVIAAGVLSLLSLVGALIVAVRAQHALRLTGNDPATVRQLNDREQLLNEKNRQLNTENRQLNTTVQQLNTEIEQVNGLLTELNTYRTIFDQELNAAERISLAHRTFPNASQTALAQILELSKATVNSHWPSPNGHRTLTEQE